jgi:5-methylcytosine-specific restriction endonuclease McrBC regulatory subunit McrC
MNNLIRWLDYCTRISYPFINISTELSDEQNFKELFMTLYIGYVRSAIERGLYYRYVDETDDICCIKGKFDIKDYVTKKIPNGQADKFRCTYSTFEFDNLINRVIKYTCKLILNSTESRKNQKAIRSILVRMNEVSDVQCNPSDCDKIRLSRLQSQYRVIMSMSKMFLLNKTSGYTMDNTESFCFLFPTELLFEGFIGGFMQEIVENNGGKVFLQKSEMNLISNIKYGDKSLGSAFNMKMDIVVECNGQIFILDTKYKQVDRFEDDPDGVKNLINSEVQQHDVYQVCEYARVRGASDVYLLYPMFRYEDNEPENPCGESSGVDKTINIHFVRLPFIFEDDTERVRKQLAAVIMKILNMKQQV